MLGVEKCLETIGDVKDAVVDGVALARAAAGGGVLSWPALLSAVVKEGGDVKELVADAPAAWPELKDIDAVEAGKLAAASYEAFKAIVTALKG